MKKFKFLQKNKFNQLPNGPGVYCFKNKKEILYIGKAANIKERVKQHKELLSLAKQLGYIKTDSEIEALILEANLIKKYQPKYNVVWRDDKNYFYVGITRGELPRILITHQKKENTEYLGPFVEGMSLKRTLTFLRRVFPYYTSRLHPKGSCLWCNLKLCPGPHPDPKEYQRNIKNLIAVLKGKSKTVLKNLKKGMEKFSQSENYETATRIRDQIRTLEKVISHSRVLEPAGLVETKFPPAWQFQRIEAYDVSNIQGQEATGSMVVFTRGRPDKNQYRKFKVKAQGKPDDVAMIKEILKRRLGHPEWSLPALILIDGGKAQFNAAKSVVKSPLYARSAHGKMEVMAIVKKENSLYTERREKPFLLKNLPREIFNLILQLRDEAHRFAISYHRKLRKKDLLKN